ncbi:HelD family protein [Actinopolymorpha singaporensis]|uniref:DNA helicase IV n=1 Tax=Actinopolymorpha singaporensis TaxID=117157 RepID=A0A1H1LHK7_9ACTN|nr:ATP-binding domain-containing protein [Actinopolymorpha singaporensis]SDR73996.1 DNA helicase IV [Actinopolymorpha singaporensis]
MPTHETLGPPDTSRADPLDFTDHAGSTDPAATTDPLTAEQAHLAASRDALRRMRERTESLEAEGGNAVSTEYLKATLYRRARSLADDPSTPLFFGRLDYAPGAGPTEDLPGARGRTHSAHRGERFYIGRRHVTDAEGDPMVVDWRAGVSRPFYRATRSAPMGVQLRRRFGFHHADLTAYEDEHLTDRSETDAASSILETEIERPRVGPMRDIVATIQPEQDDIVRADLAGTVCVQGAPGTGKTAVGLHRAAFLLYAHRDQLRRQGVLVVGPNDSFLRYIGDVLPALGEIEARQSTLPELVGRVRIRAEDPADVATLKGDARLAEVLRRAVWSHLRAPAEGLVVPRGARRFRVPAYEVSEILGGIRDRGVRYGAGGTILPQRLAHAVLLRMEADGDSPDDRVQNSVARSRPVRAYADQVWPAIDPVRLVFRLLSEPAFLAEHADGLLDEDEQALLAWARPPRSAGSARWSLADAVLIDEVADLLERTPSLGHVVLDEAQDLSPMQLRAVGRRCSTGSATVLGDLAQATTPWATRAWDEALAHLGKPDGHVEELTKGFRVPADVIAFAARLLPHIAPTLTPPSSVRRSRGDLEVVAAADPAAALAATVDGVRAALDRPGSVGLIVADAQVGALRAALDRAGVPYAQLGEEGDVDARLDVVPASLAKGLEFDHVVLAEPARIVAGEHDEVTGLRRLYVCLTRAVTSLRVVHAEPLPRQLTPLGEVPADVIGAAADRNPLID